MSKIPYISHPLKRDGKSQMQRTVGALSPDSVKVDERTNTDLLDFMFKFSRQIRFYDTSLKSSDWTAFFRRSLPFIISNISKTDTTALLEGFNSLAAEASRFENREGIRLLLQNIQTVFWQIFQWNEELQEDQSGLGTTLRNLIQTNLSTPAQQLIAWSNYHQVGGNRAMESLLDFGLEWQINPTDLSKVESLLEGVMGSEATKMRAAIKKLDALFRIFWAGMDKVVKQAAASVQLSLKGSNAHAPHTGLLFAFLELFEKARNNPADKTGSSLNAATRKHLDFFYEKVLGMTLKEATPDKAHLIFELAKNLPPFKLDKGAVFKADKDSKGIPINFSLDDEIVVTNTQVADLRTLYLEQEYPDPDAHPRVKKVRMAPVANSANGLGEAFPKEGLPAWKTLGWHESKMTAGNSTSFIPYPDARLGLVVASKVLHLKGGRRTIKLTLTCKLPDKGFEDVKQNINQYWTSLKAVTETHYSVTKKVLDDIDAAGFTTLASGDLGTLSEDQRYFDDLETFLEDMKLRIEAIAIYTDEQFESDSIILTRYIERHHAFDICFGIEKEWIKASNVSIGLDKTVTDTYTITYTIKLDEDFPSISWFDKEEATDKLDSYLPMLRLDFQKSQQIDTGISLYHFFRYLLITNITCDVTVCNLRDLFIQTDAGVQEAGKPFMPFGPIPKVGNRFFIGSDEVFRKNLNSFIVNIKWKDAPDDFDFNKYYRNYTFGGINKSEFKIKAEILIDNIWKQIADGKNIFESDTLTVPELSNCSRDFTNFNWLYENNLSKNNDGNINPINPLTTGTKNGFIGFELTKKTFQHEAFGQVFARQATAQAMLADNKSVGGAIYQKVGGTISDDLTAPNIAINKTDYIVELPNEPYTPIIEELSIDYTASASKQDIRLFHLYPYEGTFKKESIDNKPSILPKFEEEGTLYIGLKDLTPGDNVHLLFQLAESTANPDEDPVAIEWHYLRSNEWIVLEKDADVLSDETAGLLKSGVVKIAVPTDIDKNNTILPPTLHWLKVSASQKADAVSETIAIHTQAARATFLPEKESDTARLSVPLPVGSIKKPLVEVAAIKSINQPYPSFGGQPMEGKPSFYRRTSERLRHKGRAVTIFDYERMVLQAFPEIYKVKCITHTLGLPKRDNDFQLAPGHVLLAVIPDLRQLKFADRLEPKATRSLLDEVEHYVRQRTSPFVQVRALNPRYEKFRVSCNVRFVPGKSISFYKQQLMDDLQKFLAPWAFEEGKEIDFGGVVYKSVILRFMEGLGYVDYLTDFKLIDLSLDVSGQEEDQEVDQITPSSARSILVAEKHSIQEIEEPCCKKNGNVPVPGAKGIGYLAIGNMAVPGQPEREMPCKESEPCGEGPPEIDDP